MLEANGAGKTQSSPQSLFHPMPAVLVGVNTNGKLNFMAVAWCGVAYNVPPMLLVIVDHHWYTIRGINLTWEFSVNVPSTDMVREADYCGYCIRNKG